MADKRNSRSADHSQIPPKRQTRSRSASGVGTSTNSGRQRLGAGQPPKATKNTSQVNQSKGAIPKGSRTSKTVNVTSVSQQAEMHDAHLNLQSTSWQAVETTQSNENLNLATVPPQQVMNQQSAALIQQNAATLQSNVQRQQQPPVQPNELGTLFNTTSNIQQQQQPLQNQANAFDSSSNIQSFVSQPTQQVIQPNESAIHPNVLHRSVPLQNDAMQLQSTLPTNQMRDLALENEMDQDDLEADEVNRLYEKFLIECNAYHVGMKRLKTIAETNDLAYEALETQLDLLENYWTRVHHKANALEDSQMLPPFYLSQLQSYMLETDDLYSEVKTALRTRKNKKALPSASNNRTEPNPLDNVALKRVTVERFNGDYKKWPNFKSKFCQFFHDNSALPTLTKFFRLDEHIEVNSEPYNLISGYDRVADNYQVAWEQLCATYDNKRKLVDEIISSFIDLPPMPSATRGNLMVVINAINHLTKALVRYEEVKVDGWDPILVNLTLRKIDTETLSRWQHERPQRDIAKLTPLMAFLTNRAESMTGGVTSAGSTAASTSTASTAAHQSNHNLASGGRGNQFAPRSNQVRGGQSVTVKCLLCGGPHQLFSCKIFRKLPEDDMWTRVGQYKVCENCLRKGCSPERCKLGPCKHCGAKHNGLLCYNKNKPTVANAAVATAPTTNVSNNATLNSPSN